MGKTTHEITKPLKKRAKEVGVPVLVRLQAPTLKILDAWRRQQTDLPGRPEAIRRLIEALQDTRGKN